MAHHAGFGYGPRRRAIERRGRIPVALDGPTRWRSAPGTPGEAQIDDGAICGRFEARASSSALIALCAAHQEPLVFPTRERRRGAAGSHDRLLAAVGGAARVRRALARRRDPQRARAQAARSTPRRARSPRRRRRRCPRRSAASATGTIASAGSATRRSRSRRCCISAARARPTRSSGGCCTRRSSPTRTCRSSTAWTAASAHRSARWTSTATAARARFGSATTPRSRRSSTSTAACCRPP